MRRTAGLLLLATALAAGGCGATSRIANPARVATKVEAPLHRRLAAQAQMATDAPAAPARRRALIRILRGRAYPITQKKRALRELAGRFPDALRRHLGERLFRIRYRAVRAAALRTIAARGWRELRGPIARSWARHQRDRAERASPERAALRRLYPDRGAGEVLWTLLRDPEAAPADRVAAWAVLMRVAQPAALRSRLRNARKGPPLMADLRAAARLGVLPPTRAATVWLRGLRASEDWPALARAARDLTPAQRSGLALRHLPAIARAAPGQRALGPPALLESLRARLAGARHIRRRPPHEGAERVPERLRAVADRLVWGDLVCLLQTVEALRRPAVRAALFRQADRDRADRDSEHGGVLDFRKTRVAARAFPPMISKHDHAYVPSDAMIAAMYGGLAHYHFHVQRVDNARHAGPGRGDRRLADRMRFNGLVFTSVGPDRINADWYRPDGIVVDLGVLERPAPGELPRQWSAPRRDAPRSDTRPRAR